MNTYPPGSELTKRLAEQGEKLVKVNFKTMCTFRLSHQECFEFRPGVQEVPESVANHKWVQTHLQPLPEEKPKFDRIKVLTKAQIAYLKADGRYLNDEQVSRWLSQLTDAQQQLFIKNVEEWVASQKANQQPVPVEAEEVEEEGGEEAEDGEPDSTEVNKQPKAKKPKTR